MPYLTSKALLSDVHGMSFLRAVLQPSQKTAAIPQPLQETPALKSAQKPAGRVEKRVLVAGS